MINYITRRTLLNRLYRTMSFLEHNDYLPIGDYKVKNNGDILDLRDKFQVNFRSALDSGNVYFNADYHSQMSNDHFPVIYFIYPNGKPLIKIFGKEIVLENNLNKDVNDFLLSRLLENDEILKN